VPRIGSNASPDLAQWRTGNVRQQLAQRLTVPERARITHLGAYVRGVSGYGAVDYRLCIWKWDGATSNTNRLLGQSALKSAPAAAFAVGSLTKVYWPLEVAVEQPAGSNIMVGISSDTASGAAIQWGVNNTGTKYAQDSGPPAGEPWPDNMKACYSEQYALSAWVEAYTAIGSAQVYRNGAWAAAGSVQVYRNGAWVDAGSVQVYRNGAWVDAS
jgi:hypothetical protein